MSEPALERAVAERVSATQRAREAWASLARRDVNELAAFVVRDEETGERIEQAPIHERFHEIADKHRRCVIEAHIESGKSTQLGIVRVLDAIGKNNSIRVCYVSNTQGQATKVSRAVQSYVANSSEYRLVYPHVRKADPWTASAWTIDRPTVLREPTFQALGVHGNIVGARIDLLVLDDVIDYENVRTKQGRDDLWNWIHSALIGRLTRTSRVIIIGTPWHPDDALHRFARQHGYYFERFPVLDDKGESTWPERFPLGRIEEKRTDLGPLEFARQMLCRARDDAESRCKREWIDKCLAKGDGLDLVSSRAEFLSTLVGWDEADIDRWLFITGVDSAVQTHASADDSVVKTIAVDPYTHERHVCEIIGGKFAARDLVDLIISAGERFDSHLIVVENVSAQDFLVQWIVDRGKDLPVVGFTTGRNKANPDFGVESLFVEFSNGLWVIPNNAGQCSAEVAKFIEDCLYFDPKGHTGDRLMAAWFCREGARRLRGTEGGVTVKAYG